MRQLIFALFVLIIFPSFCQTTVNDSFLHGGINRTYSFYVPAIYDANQPVPLILNLHGYTSNGAQQSFYGNFKNIADTANFIVAHPDGTFDSGSNRFWNVGFSASGVDDVGFLEALIDTISAAYNIDPRRIYTTGMSNGGYMSYRLVCESDRFAAMASVTGSMTLLNYNNCSPSKPTPVMEIHGTADATVPYNGFSGSVSTPNVLSYWATFNNCPTPPTMTIVPDTNPTDGATAEHYVYAPGDGGVTIEHFKVINGAHTWPGSSFTTGVTCQDFSASKEIWRFFSQFEHPTADIKEDDMFNRLSAYPNPSEGVFSLKTTKTNFEVVEISDLNGRIVFAQENVAITEKFDLSNLEAGVYLFKADDQLLRIEIIK
jgi:polyhydroxybutyrate depolymerase